MRKMCFGILLGSMVVYMCRSHTYFLSKGCGDEWNGVHSGLLMFFVCLSQSHCSLYVVMEYM